MDGGMAAAGCHRSSVRRSGLRTRSEPPAGGPGVDQSLAGACLAPPTQHCAAFTAILEPFFFPTFDSGNVEKWKVKVQLMLRSRSSPSSRRADSPTRDAS